MARGQKKEALTPEERLQAALVPESEQPYKVPGNWCWVRVSSVCVFERGITFPASAKEKEPTNTNIPCLRTANVQDELEIDDLIYVDKAYMKGNEAKLVQKDDIIMSSANSRELVGKTSYVHDVPFPMTFGGFVLTIRAKAIISKFLFYFLRLEFLSGHFMGESTQTTNIANINTTKLGGYALSLPPLAEQQRIVDRIESLFAKLDEAKQKAQDALDSFETRKAAILHKAFTGELTAQWRKEHGVRMESWKKSRFDEVATIKSNLVNPLDFPDLPHIAPDNIERKTGVLLEYHTVSEDGVTSGKHRFYPGQILYSKIRPYLSKVVVVDFNGLCSADMYPIEAEENARCLWYYMLSEGFLEQASSAGSRSVLPKINQKELSALTVVLPTLKDEQEEIVRILDDVFAKEQQAKEAAEGVLEQIDLIKKAILARAFRGELSTNVPGEESAIKLLERSFSETIESEIVRHKQVAKQKAEVVFMTKTIMEALSMGVRLTPENLKRETELPIDGFYAQLKELIDVGSVVESRENGESYLEAANENRQTENQ